MIRSMGCLLFVALLLAGCGTKIANDFRNEMRRQRALRGECRFVYSGRQNPNVVCPEDPEWENAQDERAEAIVLEKWALTVLQNTFYAQQGVDQRLAGMSPVAKARVLYEQYLHGYRGTTARKIIPAFHVLPETVFCFYAPERPFNHKGWFCAPVRKEWGEP
ncbi:hypothetical protein [Geothermobacter hydrogeniphilus]|uniref:Lipoprotein n=1 Tax=Geothermobacter hydrogeniphilus TaxID=1969733 RepID=A0A1X0XXE2_9BACT|nr:hypothetical protein [Geothermobacter hydrogeniphilus]ORJ57509.1 hypothetical protein B5V00_13750 [Geothermobacter hydrogeniphilus]